MTDPPAAPSTHLVTAAARWADTWESAWPAGDADAIAALYASDATYRSDPFGEPEPGGALAYTRRVFATERDVRCRFGAPVVGGDRASVEWWASWVEGGAPITLAGVSMLRFEPGGLVTEHVDYWRQVDGRRVPFNGWGGGVGYRC